MRKGGPNDLGRELAATALVEAAINPDEEVCRRYGISRRALQHYRRESPTDRLLAGAVARKKAALDRAWAERMPEALNQGMMTIRSMLDAETGMRKAQAGKSHLSCSHNDRAKGEATDYVGLAVGR